MYAIIDIETTGLSPDKEKITEIAVFVYDGNTVVDEFVSLVNPERPIPYFITRLTGITNKMVSNAPKFYEIARKIIEITDSCLFVAHNVDFDYGFIKAEFASLGYDYKKDKLCTVKLSKKLIPGKKSYSLGKLTSELGIQIDGRHRAAGDALATLKLFQILLKLDAKSKPLIEEMAFHSLKGLHPFFKRSILENLPEKTGVYYFYDENHQLIYVGKSINIRSRVLQHLNNQSTRKAVEMKSRIFEISFEITGSELVALLLESDEIKKNTPLFNRSQRRSNFNFGTYCFPDNQGYLNLQIRKNEGDEIPLTSFNSLRSAKEFMERFVIKYELCHKLCGLYKSQGQCFHYGIKECKGACIGQESFSDYNQRVLVALKEFEFPFRDFLILDKGREPGEKAVVKVKGGSYRGFGYARLDYTNDNIELLEDCVKKYKDNRDVQIILKGFVDRKLYESIIPL